MAIEKRHFKKSKNKNLMYLMIGLAGLIVLLIILNVSGVIGNKNEINVETAKVEKRSISELITASGKLRPEKEISISADVSGEIIELPFKEGDRVKKGELLVRIKPDEYRSMLEEYTAAYNSSLAGLENAKANLQQAKALFEKAKTLYERYLILKEKKAVSDTEFERVESEYLSARAQYESAQQGVQTAKYNVVSSEARKRKAAESLNKTSIYSPIDGIITRLNNQLGERVVGTAQMQGTVIMRIADLNKMVAVLEVNENDIVRVNPGDSATIEVDAFRNEKFKGIVTEIANSSKDQQGLSEQITTFEIKVLLLEDSYKHLIKENSLIKTPFRPGMSVLVDIYTKKAENVLSIPILAVTTRSLNPEGKEFRKHKETAEQSEEQESKSKTEVVFLYQNGKAVMKPVKIGIQDDYYIEITEGLKEGDEIISGPYSVVSKILKDQQSVRKKVKSDKPEKPENRKK
ncbi:MAG: efflux RND transporter periplasmic adaptor subunit [Sphingobacteriales bacterium]|nr:efflux RND transporter periplasmic adaptor subunit [Sphingobacteriales bacterium]